MVKIVINETELDVPGHYTLLQACELAGVEIPRFCFHERLSVAGNCRMCLVELKGAPKPVVSCAYAVQDCRKGPNGEPPVVRTGSGVTDKARKGVLEFILLNHPLDCPICDQGGHCDLQDQAMAYGYEGSRSREEKRSVREKYLGPLIRTAMNRCIHCTRCVRFATEVAGVPDLGTTGRGEHMEITSYLEHAMQSELQGNVADLCPVGALVHKPQSYQARSWELHKVESTDVMDALGSSISVCVRGDQVLQIEPRLCETINEEWISDKTRYVVDGLLERRLDTPLIKQDGAFRSISWEDAFACIVEKFRKTRQKRIGAIAGDLSALEELFALKLLMQSLGVHNIDCRDPGEWVEPSWGRSAYLFNPMISGVEEADVMLLVGVNPRLDASMLNVKIRKRWLSGHLTIGLVGEKVDLTYSYDYLGNTTEQLMDVLKGKHSFAQSLRTARRPIIVIGQDVFSNTQLQPVAGLCARLALEYGLVREGWNGFAVLHRHASRVGALDLQFVPKPGALGSDAMSLGKDIDVLYNLGNDRFDISPGPFVIYQGTHGDRGAQRADLILPGATYVEKNAFYLNTEGRLLSVNRAIFPPGQAKEDWAILRALSGYLGKPFGFDRLSELRQVLFTQYPRLIETKPETDEVAKSALLELAKFDTTTEGMTIPIVENEYYLSNVLSRASKTLQECAALRKARADSQMFKNME